jgi:hypothetical protein
MRAVANGDEDAPSAIEVIKYHLRKNSLQAAQDLLNRAYGNGYSTTSQGGETPCPRGRMKEMRSGDEPFARPW